MTEGLGLVVRVAFDQLQLHRLEANIQPDNTSSLNLVRRLGFRREGYSTAFQFINGKWRDHERWAITAEMAALPPSVAGRPGGDQASSGPRYAVIPPLRPRQAPPETFRPGVPAARTRPRFTVVE